MLGIVVTVLVVFALLAALFGRQLAQGLLLLFVILTSGTATVLLSPGAPERGFGANLSQIAIISFGIWFLTGCVAYLFLKIFGVSDKNVNEIADGIGSGKTSTASGCMTILQCLVAIALGIGILMYRWGQTPSPPPLTNSIGQTLPDPTADGPHTVMPPLSDRLQDTDSSRAFSPQATATPLTQVPSYSRAAAMAQRTPLSLGLKPSGQGRALGLYAPNGQFVPGEYAHDSTFVPGVRRPDGLFIPGRFATNGEFIPDAATKGSGFLPSNR